MAFGALVKRKRGQKRLTQQTLAEDVFGDSSRKADISRIENAKVEPQEATIQKLCSVLNITDGEMTPIRVSSEQLESSPRRDNSIEAESSTRTLHYIQLFTEMELGQFSPTQVAELLKAMTHAGIDPVSVIENIRAISEGDMQ